MAGSNTGLAEQGEVNRTQKVVLFSFLFSAIVVETFHGVGRLTATR